MIVICYGVEKSGSTLAFEMTKAVLELAGHPQTRLEDGLVSEAPPINEVGSWSDERLDHLVAACAGTIIAVRTHHRPRGLTEDHVRSLLDAGDLRIQVAFRDPRDTVASLLDDGVRARRLGERRHADLWTVEDAAAILGRRLRALRQWGSYPSLRVRYEQVAFDPVHGPELLAADLGVDTDPAAVWDLVEQRNTRKNVARPERYRTDLWPDEVAWLERAFPLYLAVVRGDDVVGWFDRDA